MKKFFSNKCNYSKELRNKTVEYFRNNFHNSLKYTDKLGPLYNFLLMKNFKQTNMIEDTFKYENEIFEKIIDSFDNKEINLWLYNKNNIKLILKNILYFESDRNVKLLEDINKFIIDHIYLYNSKEINDFNRIFSHIKNDYETVQFTPLIYSYHRENLNKIGKNYVNDLNFELFDDLQILYNIEHKSVNIISNNNKINIKLLFYNENNHKDINDIINFISEKKELGSIFILNNIDLKQEDLKNNKNSLKSIIEEIEFNNKKEQYLEFDNNYHKINNKNKYFNYIENIKKEYKIDEAKRIIVNKKNETINYLQSLTYSILNQIYEVKRDNIDVNFFKNFESDNILKIIKDYDDDYFKELFYINLEIEKNLIIDFSSKINKYGCFNCSGKKNKFFLKEDIIKYSNYNEIYKKNIQILINNLFNKNKNWLNNGTIIIPINYVDDYVIGILEYLKSKKSENDKNENFLFEENSLDKLLLLSKTFNINKDEIKKWIPIEFYHKYNNLENKIKKLYNKNDIFNLQFSNKKSYKLDCEIISKEDIN